MIYRISFDGPASTQIEKLLQSAQMHLNGRGLLAQAPALETSTSDSTKGGHDVFQAGHEYLPVIIIALVVGGLAGYVGGFCAARIYTRSTKGGHD